MLEERSVTRAASRLFITQSAMSKTLNRLREQFNDPLVVRSGSGLVPTPRAEALQEPLREIVEKIEACLTPEAFDPVNAKGRIRIAAPEQFALATLPELLGKLRKEAPNLVIDSQHLMDEHSSLLNAGLLDLVINREKSHSEDVCATQLYVARSMCWCRKGHPLTAQSSVELADICSYPLVTLRSQNYPPHAIEAVRREIQRASLKSNVILSTSHLILAVDALVRCDALMLAPDYLSRAPIFGDFIEGMPISHIPCFSSFRTELYLLEHKRTIKSPLHRWVCQKILDAFVA